MTHHPLLAPMDRVRDRISLYTDHARGYFNTAVLLPFACPACGGGLIMTGPSRALCAVCGRVTDPTEVFQRSPCCGESLHRARAHYLCARCHSVVPSRFLFVEHVFDAAYFRERMAESRDRLRRRRVELRRLLARARGGAWIPDSLPGPGATETLFSLLDDLAGVPPRLDAVPRDTDTFSLDQYRDVIRACLAGGMRRFDALPSLHADLRLDRARRFVALVYMEHFSQVTLRQAGESIMVMSRCL